MLIEASLPDLFRHFCQGVAAAGGAASFNAIVRRIRKARSATSHAGGTVILRETADHQQPGYIIFNAEIPQDALEDLPRSHVERIDGKPGQILYTPDRKAWQYLNPESRDFEDVN